MKSFRISQEGSLDMNCTKTPPAEIFRLPGNWIENWWGPEQYAALPKPSMADRKHRISEDLHVPGHSPDVAKGDLERRSLDTSS